MTKSELRKARRKAIAEGRPLTGDLAPERHANDRQEFTETARGYRARERWARRHDDLNGAPESGDDR